MLHAKLNLLFHRAIAEGELLLLRFHITHNSGGKINCTAVSMFPFERTMCVGEKG